MPDVQEVFRMATQKVRRDPGAMERHIARQQKAARNRRVGAYATVAVLVAAAVAIFTLTRPQTQSPPLEPTQIPTATTGSTLDLRTGQLTKLPASIASAGTFYAVSPDQTQVAFNACCSNPGPLQLANIDGTQVHPVSAAGWDAYGAQWSRDGSTLVYQQRHATTQALGNLFVLDIATGRSTRITDFDQTKKFGWWFIFPSFSSDGGSVLYQLPRSSSKDAVWDLWSVPVGGGTPALVMPKAGWGGYAPDGTALAWLSPVSGTTFKGGKLWVTTAPAMERPMPFVGGGELSWPRWSPDATRIAYTKNGSVYVLNVATRSITKVAEGGGNPEWIDDNTLSIGNPTN